MSEIKLMELLKGSPEISARIFVPKVPKGCSPLCPLRVTLRMCSDAVIVCSAKNVVFSDSWSWKSCSSKKKSPSKLCCPPSEKASRLWPKQHSLVRSTVSLVRRHQMTPFLRVPLGVWFHRHRRTEAQLRRCGIPHLTPFETFHFL